MLVLSVIVTAALYFIKTVADVPSVLFNYSATFFGPALLETTCTSCYIFWTEQTTTAPKHGTQKKKVTIKCHVCLKFYRKPSFSSSNGLPLAPVFTQHRAGTVLKIMQIQYTFWNLCEAKVSQRS